MNLHHQLVPSKGLHTVPFYSLQCRYFSKEVVVLIFSCYTIILWQWEEIVYLVCHKIPLIPVSYLKFLSHPTIGPGFKIIGAQWRILFLVRTSFQSAEDGLHILRWIELLFCFGHICLSWTRTRSETFSFWCWFWISIRRRF